MMQQSKSMFFACTAFALGTLTGCAANRGRVPPASVAAAAPVVVASEGSVNPRGPATSPAAALDPKALLRLDQIQPAPVLPAPRPPTTRSTQAPVDALVLYARARDAMLDGRRAAAVGLLEQAIDLDHDSFELYFALGVASAADGASPQPAIAAFESALAIRPDSLIGRLQLGRLYMVASDPARALEQLRLALLADDYHRSGPLAAMADLLLAQTLQQQGYDRAALDCFESLRRRLAQIEQEGQPVAAELNYLLTRPELLNVQIGDLYARLNQPQRAVDAYQRAMRGNEAPDFGLQARLARALVAAGRTDEAIERAARSVARYRASAQSLELLREICRSAGRNGSISDELQRLYRANPTDRSMLFALADVLVGQKQDQQAEAVLADAASRDPGDIELVRRLYQLYGKSDQVQRAARLLIEAIAARPDALRELTPLMSELTRPLRRNRLTLADVQKMTVPPAAEAARLFWVARLAEAWNRDALMRSAAQRAAALAPPFAPACRMLMGLVWSAADTDTTQKIAAADSLITRAQNAGATSLAAELKAMSLLNQHRPDDAAAALTDAMNAPHPSLELQLAYVSVLLGQSQFNHAQQLLWKLAREYPGTDDPYSTLFGLYLRRGDTAQALKALQDWLAADPHGVSPRLVQATVLMRMGRTDDAERVLDGLFAEHADNEAVLEDMRQLYVATGRLDQFIARLESERNLHPDNRSVVDLLVQIYAGQSRYADAIRALDGIRATAGNDADLLYYLAHLYTQVKQKNTGEQVLLQVLQLDPNHAQANNDLGYEWADEGRNLARAEAMIRLAVAVEPDNQAFLDSLGWVLYKRGQFDEARKYLQQAIGAAARPDAVVLDHLGDVLYRTGDHAAAAKTWQRSLAQLGQSAADDQGDELKSLRLQLLQKLKQAGENQPVNVAPSVDGPSHSAELVQ